MTVLWHLPPWQIQQTNKEHKTVSKGHKTVGYGDNNVNQIPKTLCYLYTGCKRIGINIFKLLTYPVLIKHLGSGWEGYETRHDLSNMNPHYCLLVEKI